MNLIANGGHPVPAAYQASYLDPTEADNLLAELMHTTPWQELSTRLVCWIGPVDYVFYGSAVRAQPWTMSLVALRDRLEGDIGGGYNSVLINLYRDGGDSIDWHADDEPQLGDVPTIASVSLGSPRAFRLRHNDSGDVAEVTLGHGSLTVMYDDAQSAWQHSLPAGEASAGGPRINLTYRRWTANPAGAANL